MEKKSSKNSNRMWARYGLNAKNLSADQKDNRYPLLLTEYVFLRSFNTKNLLNCKSYLNFWVHSC